MTSVPENHPHDRPHRRLERQEPALGRAEAARRLEEAHKLLDEVTNVLTEVRREILGGPRDPSTKGRPPPAVG